MITTALLAAFHYIALGIGLGSIFMRGHYLRAKNIKAVLTADSIWGVAALLWILTGLLRAFGGYEKGTAYYLQSHFFWIKMGLFLAIWALEIYPMITFIKWRFQLAKGQATSIDNPQTLKLLSKLNLIEVLLTFSIPFVASLMARGY